MWALIQSRIYHELIITIQSLVDLLPKNAVCLMLYSMLHMQVDTSSVLVLHLDDTRTDLFKSLTGLICCNVFFLKTVQSQYDVHSPQQSDASNYMFPQAPQKAARIYLVLRNNLTLSKALPFNISFRHHSHADASCIVATAALWPTEVRLPFTRRHWAL